MTTLSVFAIAKMWQASLPWKSLTSGSRGEDGRLFCFVVIEFNPLRVNV